MTRIPKHLDDSCRQLAGIQGVYAIVNGANDRVYIGSSVNVGKRLRVHVNELMAGYHPNKALNQDWRSGSPESFGLSLLAQVSDEARLADVERSSIEDAIQSGIPLYNRYPRRTSNRPTHAERKRQSAMRRSASILSR